MKDVALHAGVSTATVSRVLNGHAVPTPGTRERVLAAVEELGYRPNALARSLRTTSTQTLGLVISDLLNPFFAEIARAVEDEARSHGYCVVIGNADEHAEQEATYVRTLLDRRVDGLLLCPANDDPGLVREVSAGGVPLVLLDRTVRGATCPVVRADGSEALTTLARRLVGAGHTRVGVIAGRPGTSTCGERIAVLTAVLGDRALVAPGDHRREGGSDAAGRLIDEGVTALVALDNLMGLGALGEIKARGLRVPHDVAFAVFDDQPWFPLLDPPITVIAQPTGEMGRAAARSLIALIDGRRPDDVRLTAKLVLRGSLGDAELCAP